MEYLQEDKGIVYTAATDSDKILLLQYVNDVIIMALRHTKADLWCPCFETCQSSDLENI